MLHQPNHIHQLNSPCSSRGSVGRQVILLPIIMRNPLSMRRTRRRTQSGNLNSSASEQFRQRLQSSQLSSAFNAASFIPTSELKALIEPGAVLSILEEVSQSSKSHAELSATIVRAAPRLFVLLVWADQAHLVFRLGSQYLNDQILPLDEHGIELAKLRAIPGWSKDCEARILLDQWIFLSPSFHSEGQSISIHPSAPLPFIFASSVHKESAHSTIQQIQVHPSHLGFLEKDINDAPPILALKLFKKRGRKRFHHEVHVLQLLNQCSSLNIVRLLVAFSNQDSHGLVFPWAEGDLSELMKREITPEQRRELVPWTLEQFIGLLDGLAAIHRLPSGDDGRRLQPQCRHGDLHPANILLMKKGPKVSCKQPVGVASCRLQIASMAMTQIFQDESQYTVPLETGTYQGPECHLQIAIGPLYDIWSLGCLFLEMIIWLLEGPSGLEAFADDRIAPDPLLGERVKDDHFFTLKTKEELYVGAEVRSSVLSWIKRLQQSERLDSVFTALLSVIKSDMLVPIGSQRLEADELSRKVRNLDDNQRGDKEGIKASK